MIQLEEAAIKRALPLVAAGLEKYCWLQAALPRADVAHDHTFQTKFNVFYRVRRNVGWQAHFYRLLERQKAKPESFAKVLRALHAATGMVEASFASKLVATVEPDEPVIDAFVLGNLGLHLSRTGSLDARLDRAVEIHKRIQDIYADYLDSEIGRHLISMFEASYPSSRVTHVKMLDLILWQAR